MSGFLDYLDEFNEKNSKPVTQKKVVEEVVEPKKKSKVLSLNVEVRTPEGAQLVIEKIQDWVAKQEGVAPKKKPFRIPPKKVVKSPAHIQESKDPVVKVRSHAMDILDGLPETPTENQIPMAEGSINTTMPQMQPQQVQPNLDSVAGHASALL